MTFMVIRVIIVSASCAIAVLAVDWIDSSGAEGIFWTSSAMSRTGQLALVGEEDGGRLYMSNDFGRNWQLSYEDSSVSFKAVDISSDGRYAMAVGEDKILYSSDSMDTWQEASVPSMVYYNGRGAMSSTGHYAAVLVPFGAILISSDYCQTFTNSSAPGDNWVAISTDGTGQYMVALASYGGIYYSHDYGNNWAVSDAPDAMWQSVMGMNEAGDFIIAMIEWSQDIHISRDYGVTWQYTGSFVGYRDWLALAGTETLQDMLLGGDRAALQTSTDQGRTWDASGGEDYVWYTLSVNYNGTLAFATRREHLSDGSYDQPNIYFAVNPIESQGTQQKGLAARYIVIIVIGAVVFALLLCYAFYRYRVHTRRAKEAGEEICFCVEWAPLMSSTRTVITVSVCIAIFVAS
jgi:photosystem II stability/assembly factor-like uncharacterized protein